MSAEMRDAGRYNADSDDEDVAQNGDGVDR